MPNQPVPAAAEGLPQSREARDRVPAGSQATIIPANRREFLRQLAAASVLTVPVAVAALAHPGEPDAALVRLGAAFKDCIPGWLVSLEESKRLSDIFDDACNQARITARSWDAWCQLRIATGFEGSIEAVDKKLEELNELSDRIRAIPALGPAGLAVKASVLLFDCGSAGSKAPR